MGTPKSGEESHSDDDGRPRLGDQTTGAIRATFRSTLSDFPQPYRWGYTNHPTLSAVIRSSSYGNRRLIGVFPRFGMSGTPYGPLLLPYGSVQREVSAGFYARGKLQRGARTGAATPPNDDHLLPLSNERLTQNTSVTGTGPSRPVTGTGPPRRSSVLYPHPYWDFLPIRPNPGPLLYGKLEFVPRVADDGTFQIGVERLNILYKPTPSSAVPRIKEDWSTLLRAFQPPDVVNKPKPSGQSGTGTDEGSSVPPVAVDRKPVQGAARHPNSICVDESTTIMMHDDDEPGSFPITEYRHYVLVLDPRRHCFFCKKGLWDAPNESLPCGHSIHSGCCITEENPMLFFPDDDDCYFCVTKPPWTKLVYGREV